MRYVLVRNAEAPMPHTSPRAAPPDDGWPDSVALPQRFSTRYDRYKERGGLVDVAGDGLAYAGGQPIQDVERLMFLSLAFDQICKEGVEGDFAELGVYQGSTAAVLARHARRLGRRIYLLDTFDGFDAQDFNGPDSGRRAEFGDTSLEAVRARVGCQGASYIKGRFPATAASLPDDGRYCLVHIDADLYAPIISGLEYFYPRVVPGGYLIVHDYGSLWWDGAEKAVDVFFADKPEAVIQIPDSCGSAVVRRLRPSGARSNWIARRQSLPPDVWHPAGNGRLASVLTGGWSSPETWGVWGVGASHSLRIVYDAPPGQTVGLDIDLQAFVWDGATGRQVDVFANGRASATASFDTQRRRTELSLEKLAPSEQDSSIVIEFRPRTIASPKDVLPGADDARQLGIGLHRLRLRSPEPA